MFKTAKTKEEFDKMLKEYIEARQTFKQKLYAQKGSEQAMEELAKKQNKPVVESLENLPIKEDINELFKEYRKVFDDFNEKELSDLLNVPYNKNDSKIDIFKKFAKKNDYDEERIKSYLTEDKIEDFKNELEEIELEKKKKDFEKDFGDFQDYGIISEIEEDRRIKNEVDKLVKEIESDSIKNRSLEELEEYLELLKESKEDGLFKKYPKLKESYNRVKQIYNEKAEEEAEEAEEEVKEVKEVKEEVKEVKTNYKKLYDNTTVIDDIELLQKNNNLRKLNKKIQKLLTEAEIRKLGLTPIKKQNTSYENKINENNQLIEMLKNNSNGRISQSKFIGALKSNDYIEKEIKKLIDYIINKRPDIDSTEIKILYDKLMSKEKAGPSPKEEQRPIQEAKGLRKSHNNLKLQDSKFGKLQFVNLEDLILRRRLNVRKNNRYLYRNKRVDQDLIDLLTKRYNPKRNYSSHSIKLFRELVKQSELPVAPYSGKQKLVDGNGLQAYTSIDEMVDELEVLIGELDAGNNSDAIKNEIGNIIDYLLKKKEITKLQHRKLFEKYVA